MNYQEETKLSINVSWAYNCAVASLNDSEKGLTWKKRGELIDERQKIFMNKYKIAMIENTPEPKSIIPKNVSNPPNNPQRGRDNLENDGTQTIAIEEANRKIELAINQ